MEHLIITTIQDPLVRFFAGTCFSFFLLLYVGEKLSKNEKIKAFMTGKDDE